MRRALVGAGLLAIASGALSGCSSPSLDADDAVIPPEQQIRVVVENGFNFLSKGDSAAFDQLQCPEKRVGDSSPSGNPDPDLALLRGLTLDSVDTIVVTGDTATAVTHHHSARAPDKPLSDTVALRLHDGNWLIC
ncbi:MAG: hypothetical protein WA988_18930 [Candidatus Nanopelagicales bacterium]